MRTEAKKMCAFMIAGKLLYDKWDQVRLELVYLHATLVLSFHIVHCIFITCKYKKKYYLKCNTILFIII